MTTTTLLAIVGVGLVVWPVIAKVLGGLSQAQPSNVVDKILATGTATHSPTPSRPQSFESALAALAAVRRRLADTKQLNEESEAAIERVTQALVAGSSDE